MVTSVLSSHASKKEKTLDQDFWTFLFVLFFFFSIVRFVKKTTWNQADFKFVGVDLKSLVTDRK